MTYCVVVEYIGNETAQLECESLAEAHLVRQSFANYGLDIVDVRIEKL